MSGKSIVFFKTKEKALDTAKANGGEAAGFFVELSKRNEDEFVIAVYDMQDDPKFFLGYL